jgi:hypothetical protein
MLERVDCAEFALVTDVEPYPCYLRVQLTAGHWCHSSCSSKYLFQATVLSILTLKNLVIHLSVKFQCFETLVITLLVLGVEGYVDE